MSSLSLRGAMRWSTFGLASSSISTQAWVHDVEPLEKGPPDAARKPVSSLRKAILNASRTQFWVDKNVHCPGDILPSNAVQDYHQAWCLVTVLIDLDFDDDTAPNLIDALKDYWKYSIETWWSNRWAARHGDELACPLQFRVLWSDEAHDIEVDVEKGTAPSDYGEWFLNESKFADGTYVSRDARFTTYVIVHEYGHYIGLLDEYKDTWSTCPDDPVFQANILAFPSSTMRRIDFPPQQFPAFPAWHMSKIAGNVGCDVVPIPNSLESFDLAAALAGGAARYQKVRIAMGYPFIVELQP